MCIVFSVSQNISSGIKGPKEKYKKHYGRCTELLLGLQYSITPAAETTNEIQKRVHLRVVKTGKIVLVSIAVLV